MKQRPAQNGRIRGGQRTQPEPRLAEDHSKARLAQ